MGEHIHAGICPGFNSHLRLDQCRFLTQTRCKSKEKGRWGDSQGALCLLCVNAVIVSRLNPLRGLKALGKPVLLLIFPLLCRDQLDKQDPVA